MKKIIFTLLLAIVSSVWMMSKAICMVAGTHIDGPTVSISGVLIQTAMPCEADTLECPPCLTLALSANEDLYYLSTTDPVVERQLDSIMSELVSVNCICEQPAVVTGVLYMRGGFHYIAISSITVLGDIQPKNEDLRLNSLCNEWNIAKISNAMGPYEEIHTVKAALSTDTIIGTQKYVKLFEAGRYKGALREGTNRDIYYIPSGSAHEYLLYNFNANVGDRLSNLWYGGSAEWCPNGYNATVLSISEETPRVFTVEVEYIISDSEGDHIDPWVVFWTEGVGLSDGPAGQICPGPDCACSCGQVVLCAYKNGEQVYTSDLGKTYGCEYNYDPYSTPEDTIPLFIKDNPGTSTVDPADPNLIYAVLRNDMLIIRDFTGVEIFFTLSRNGSLFGPRRARSVQAQQSFTDSTSVELTEEGTYDIELTSESWNYIVIGSFDFNKTHEAVEIITSELPAASKILRNGQLLIRIGDQLYTPSGVLVQ